MGARWGVLARQPQLPDRLVGALPALGPAGAAGLGGCLPLQQLLTRGTSAVRQLSTWERSGDLRAVARQVVAEGAPG